MTIPSFFITTAAKTESTVETRESRQHCHRKGSWRLFRLELNVADLINVPCGVLIEHVERDDGSKRAIISAWLAYEVVDRKEPPVWEKADSDSEVDEGNGNTTPSLHGHDPI